MKNTILALFLMFLLVPQITLANLIENPSFEDGTNHWGIWYDTSASFNFDVDPATFVHGGFSGKATYVVSSAWWDCQINQSEIGVDSYTWYQFSFWAKATSEKWVKVRLVGESGEFYGLEEDFCLSTQWQEYSCLFKTTCNPENARLSFNIGLFEGESHVADIWLDHMDLAAYSMPTPEPTFTPIPTNTPLYTATPTCTPWPTSTPFSYPENLIQNPGFEEGEAYWGSWDDVVFEVDGSEFVDGGFSAKVWNGTSETWWDRQLNQSEISIEDNQWYRLSFSMKVIADKMVGLRLWSSDSQHVYGLESDVLI